MSRKNLQEKNLSLRKSLPNWGFIIIVLVLVILSILLVIFFLKLEKAKDKQEIEKLTDYLAENCNCTEKERILCPNGFELEKDRCVDGKRFTNVLKACSEYSCLDEKFKFEDGKWQSQN